jgi:hypothetical protein
MIKKYASSQNNARKKYQKNSQKSLSPMPASSV